MKKKEIDHQVGAQFQEETKYNSEKLSGYTLDWDHLPEPYKNHDSPLATIVLPKPVLAGNPNIWNALQKRRSRRLYITDKTLTLGDVSALLWATQGATAKHGDTFFRTAPSAGGLHPVETYLHIRAVDGLEPGLYHFRPRAFDLEYLKSGDHSRYLMRAALDQSVILGAQLAFIWSAIMARGRWKYRQRAYRYIYLDAGHIAQNLYLAAEALGLGVCAIGAFYDNLMNELFNLDGVEETVIYMAAVGWPAEE